jgi:F-type H+-transporting ATPase subunit epsilon
MASFPISLVTPERILFEGEAEMVTMRSGGGDIAFLAGHEPYVSTVEIGVVRIDVGEGQSERFAAHGGFVEVNEGSVTVLSGVAERPDEVDVARAQRAKEQAEQRASDGDDAEAEAALRRATTRLELAEQR